MTGRSSRRSLLAPLGVEGATGGLTNLLWSDAPAGPGVQKHCCVSRRAMACDFSVLLAAGQPNPVEAGCAALDEVERLEAKLTVYRADSDISRINQNAAAAPVRVDYEVFELLRTARALSDATGGAFDAASGTLTKAWGFLDGNRRLPAEDELRAALEASGSVNIELDAAGQSVRFTRPGIEINLGAIGKGYAIDRAVHVLRAQFGIRSALVQGGQSSLRALGTPPGEYAGWKIAVGDPFDPKRPPIAFVRLRNRALGTSGTAFQYFVVDGRRYGHVLDPRTGRPAEQLASATVLAPTAAEADALSTAFFVAGADMARHYCRQHRDVSAVLVTRPIDAKRPEVIIINFGPGEIEYKEVVSHQSSVAISGGRPAATLKTDN